MILKAHWAERSCYRRLIVQQLLRLWSGLDLRKRLLVALATLTMFVTILGLSRLATAPNMTLLYAGLESGAAGDVVRALEQRGAQYTVRGSSIFVESSQRDEYRMTLASEGLPANGISGYEVLDSLSGFGTTSQMFDAAYWRAKEGELARTIVASPSIQQARVHIANTSTSPFQRETLPTASVTVLTSGGGLTVEKARALRFLIASAVAGLKPEDVAVIDGAGGLIGSVDEGANTGPEDQNRALRERIERLLEARVGVGNAVVELSVERITETESIVERRYDPDGRVLVSSETEENVNNSRNGSEGDVSVSSNIPDGDAASTSKSSTQNSLTRERVDYQISETQREILRAPGAIRRITVAVLVNGIDTQTENGTNLAVPRSEEELGALWELVASAVGLEETRGDVITIKSMGFEPVLVQGSVASSSFFDVSGLNVMAIVQMLILGFVSLILGLFVVRPILSMPPPPPGLPRPDAAGQPLLAATDPASLSGEITPASQGSTGTILVSQNNLDRQVGDRDAVERLRLLINDRKDETVEILRGWLEDKEEQS